MPALQQWDSFYVIVGSAAGALIGLQFVVLTLIAERPTERGAEASAAFGTPTIVYFSVVLLLSALLRVPWGGILPVAMACGIPGLFGVGYSLLVTRQVHRQTAYEPDIEDWIWFVVLPFAGYAVLAGSGVALAFGLETGLFGAGAAALILLFSGIHNAWDSVAYHVFVVRQNRRDGE